DAALGLLLEREPIEAVRPEREEIGFVADEGKRRAAEHLDRALPGIFRQIDLGALREARQVDDDQDAASPVAANERQDLVVIGIKKLDTAGTENLIFLAQRD